MRFPWPTVAFGVLAVTSTVRGAPLPDAITVAWEAPAACPERAAFESELAAQLPEDAPEMTESLAVSVRIRRGAGGGYELQISTPVGERTLTDIDCAKLVRAAAFVVSLSIDVSAPVETEGLTEELDPDQQYDLESPYRGLVKPEYETPPEASAQTPVEVVTERPPIYLAMRATLGGDLGILPHPAPAVGFGMSVIRARFRLEATGSTSQSQPASTEIDPTVGANLSLWTLGLRGCYEVAPGALSGSLCAGGEIGRFQIDAFGLIPGQERETDARWWALTAAAGIERRLWGPLSVRAEAGLVARPINRLQFTAVPPGDAPPVEIHTVPVISARVMSGVEVRFR